MTSIAMRTADKARTRLENQAALTTMSKLEGVYGCLNEEEFVLGSSWEEMRYKRASTGSALSCLYDSTRNAVTTAE